MKTVKAKQTLHGSYGLKAAGDTFEVQNSVADELAEKGLVTIEGEGAADAETPKEKSSVTISDNTTKEKANIVKPTTKKSK